MGKKKSKTSKQKQAKAAAKSLKCRVVQEQHIKVETPGGKKNKKSKGKRNSMDYDEKEEFRRQQASMHERQLAEEQQRKRMKRGNNKKSNTKMFQFQAPTLIVDDAKKSTAQLLTEVTSKAQGWDGIGNQQQQQTQAFGTTPQNGAISLKTVFQTSTMLKPQSMPESKNPFAALGGDDSDDEETDMKTKESATALFQFAPATFSMPASSTITSDIDPDL